MSVTLVEKAPAKINLTLRVLGRRADGYHLLESLVAFADLADTLSLQPGGEAALDIAGPFAAACGPAAGNLVLKAFAAGNPKSLAELRESGAIVAETEISEAVSAALLKSVELAAEDVKSSMEAYDKFLEEKVEALKKSGIK